MGNQSKIIIIDDNRDYLFTMETFLQRNGFKTFTAESGQTGLDLIQKEHPDLILVDIMMEGLFAGFQLVKKVGTDPELKDIHIIGISGIVEELDVRRDKHFLMKKYFSSDNFFEKPVDKERLLTKIKELLKG